ncbi:MAG: flagellar M-ring protein FliF [Gammaproteobacteria bacterium]|nr:flagellar M-ring protein FliF [Gammaproteobacteria bacterium]NNM19990.1 flagellar M-ring protein FliF [Gammaproteobacteria bacterium]
MAEATTTGALSTTNLMDIPAVRQGLLLTGIAAAVAIGVATVLWSRTPDYSLLYANLADRDAGAIVNALMATEIPHKLDQASGAVMVPADRVHEARLLLAADGLPQGSGFGFETINEETGLGTSQSMERARLQHMVETELVRTISNLRPVQAARVHLALPRQSVFVRNRQPASASVMVQLYPGRRLEQSQVAAIINLVASSVPDLESGDVTIVDQQGRLLTDSTASSDLGLTAQQFEYRTRVENAYASRIEKLLTPLAGQGRVRAQVTAEMDFTITEQTQEIFDQDNPAVRSEQSSSQTQQGDGAIAGGVPGALSNQPPAQAAAENTETTARSSTSSAVRNFELDRTVSHVRQPTGLIQRLSVAVIVDDRTATDEDGAITNEPRSEDELARMTNLARDAIGFDEQRGDTLSVVNASFTRPESPDAVAPAWWEKPLVGSAIRQVVGVVLILGLIFGLLRPTVRHLLKPAPAPVAALPPGSPEYAALGQPVAPSLTHEQNIAAARSLVGEDPRRAARVMKEWVAEDE